MQRSILKKFTVITLVFGLCVFYMPRLSADETLSDTGDTFDMIIGDIETIPVNKLTRVSLTNPSIADISDAEAEKVSVVAKKAGETDLFLWDTNGKRTIRVRVVNEDLSGVKARVQKVLKEADITGVTLEENLDVGKVVVSGSVSKDDKTRLAEILQPYSENLLNLVNVEKSQDLIQVDMQIMEISTSMEKEMGILWGSGSSTSSTSSSSTGGSGTTSGLITENETLPASNGNGKFGDFFKVGNFSRTSLSASINAFIQEGKGRLISKPRLVAVSGKQASFLVGGEIPVLNTTTNSTGTSSTQSTTYTQYGVDVTVTPTLREGKIDIMLNVNIRDIDSSNSSNGNVAFITRSASTDLYMDNKQTVALAGLIKYSDSIQVTGIPILSKIPILGALFRDRKTPSPDTNTEMVIILTPMVLTDKKFADNQIVMPTHAENDSYKEFDAKYEHEPLQSWPAKETTVESASPKDSSGFGAVTAYARMVQEKISRAIVYPHEAQATGASSMAGTVKLKLHILKNGSLDSEEVMESSGNNILDQDALQAAMTAAPYDAFTMGMDQEDLIFTIPIVYNKLMPRGQSSMEKVIASY